MVELVATTHTYMHNGRVVPGVTETIKPLAPDFDRFPSYEARERGKLVHALTAVMDGREDLWPEMPEGREEELSGYCAAWHKFKCEADLRILREFIELPVHHERYGYAGTLDRIAAFPNGNYVLLDIKTGAYDDSHILQLAAYHEAFVAEIPHLPLRGDTMAVYLRANGTYTTRTFRGLQLKGAFTVFLALRSVAEWKKEHGPATQPDVIDDWVPLADDEVFVL